MAGPNDFHIKDGEIQPGLGRDEPSELAKRNAKVASSKELAAQKAELSKQANALTSLERDLLAQQEAQAKKAQELEERENRLLKAEAEAKGKGGAR